MEILNDTQWINGADSVSYTLGQGMYQWAQNVVNRGGILQTRQGLAEIAAIPSQDPRGGGTIVIGGVTWLLVAIGENIYKLNLNNPVNGLEILDYPGGHHVVLPVGNRRMVHFELCVQAQESIPDQYPNPTSYTTHQLPVPKFVMIIQDGFSDPHYWDGTTCDKVNNLYPHTVPHNTPKGSYMKWAGDRLWTILGRKVRASNLLNPFQNTEELIGESGGFFFLPDNVTGVGVTHDYKSMLVYTHFTTSAFQVGIETRTEWGQTQDFQRVIFPSIGCISHRTIINMYGMTWWMSHDGWVGLDNTLSAYQSSKLDVQDQNMARSKSGIKWNQGGGCSGSYGNFLWVSVPSANKWNQHTWMMDQAPINTISGTAPPVWCSNWTGIRPEQWFTCQVLGQTRCFALSRDLTNEGHQSTVWEAFIGQRMDVPKVNGVKTAKDIGCAVETRFVGLSPSQYARLRWIEVDCAEIVGNVRLQVYYCGRRTSYKKIIDVPLTATVTPSTEEIFMDGGPRIYVPQYRTIRSSTDTHETTDVDSEIQTPHTRNIDREFSALLMWSGQMAVTAVRFGVDPEPDYMEGTDYPDEILSRRITAEGEGVIGPNPPPPNTPTGATTSTFISTLRPRWVEFPSYDSAVPNGVFFVAELTASPPPGAYPSNLYPLTVNLTSETQGIDIYYTQDNTNPHGPPNPHGIHYPPRPSMILGQTLRAIGTRSGMQDSILLRGIYTQAQVATPTVSPLPDHFPPEEFPMDIHMFCATAGATIRYTINQSPVPCVTPNSALYDPAHPPHVNDNSPYMHVKAFKQYYIPSEEFVGRYVARPRCHIPTLTPDGGAYPIANYNQNGRMAVVVACTTPNSQLRYTINNEDVEHGGVISNPHTLHVHPDDTLRVIAQRENLENSLTKTGVYTTSIEQVATPTINPDAVILTGNHHEIDVAIACATSGTSMSYTISTPDVIDTPTRTHGTIVNTNSTTIHLGPNQPTRIGHRVLRVMAFRLDMRDSDIAEGTYDHEGGN